MASLPETLSFQSMVESFERFAFSISPEPLSSIDLMSQEMYLQYREELNDLFQTGEIHEFTGNVEDDTEIGDFTDAMVKTMLKLYPPEKTASSYDSLSLNITERTEWRDELIKELDAMVER